MDRSGEQYGKQVSELMGEDVKIMSDGSVVGTFPFVDNFTEFSGTKAEQSGNYFCLKLGKEYTGKNVTVERTSGTGGKKKSANETEWVLRLTDGVKTVYKITADAVPDLTLSFSEAVLKAKQ